MRKFTLLVFTLISSFARAQEPTIGHEYNDSPNPKCDYYLRGDADRLPDYAIYIATCDKRHEIWLSEWLNPSEPKPRFRIIDHLRVGYTHPKTRFNVGYPCSLRGKAFKTLDWYVLLDNSRKSPYTHKNGGILGAWRVNAMLKRLELVPPREMAKIICVPEVDPE